MRGGVVLIALALLIAYLGVTGRYKCFGVFFNCVIDPTICPGCSGGSGGGGGAGPIIVTPRPGEPPTAYDPRTHEPAIYDATTHLLPIESFV
jgi:hypothetical protein